MRTLQHWIESDFLLFTMKYVITKTTTRVNYDAFDCILMQNNNFVKQYTERFMMKREWNWTRVLMTSGEMKPSCVPYILSCTCELRTLITTVNTERHTRQGKREHHEHDREDIEKWRDGARGEMKTCWYIEWWWWRREENVKREGGMDEERDRAVRGWQR